MSEFPSFLRLNDTPLYVYNILSLFIAKILLNAFIFFTYIHMDFMYQKIFEVIYFPLVLIPAY